MTQNEAEDLVAQVGEFSAVHKRLLGKLLRDEVEAAVMRERERCVRIATLYDAIDGVFPLKPLEIADNIRTGFTPAG